MTILAFDADEHAYTLDGVRVPSVTQLLQAAGLVTLHGKAEEIAYWRDRGTAVHIATELDDRDELDEATVVAEVWPYLRAWRKFKAETGFAVEYIEERLAHPALRYAGTIDRLGGLGGRRVIVDIKTGSPARTTGVQLAAYAHMAAANDLCRKDARRFAVHLADDATYQVVPYTDSRDLIAFMATLQLWNWRNAK